MAGVVILSLGAISNVASGEGQDPYFQQEGGDSISYLPPVYVFDNYSVTFNVSVIDNDDANPKSFVVNSVSVSNNFPNSSLFDYATSTSSVTITTGDESPFDDYFQFMYYGNNGEYAYRDDWTPQEAIDNGFFGITKWQHPSFSEYLITHTVTVEAVSTDGTETINTSVPVYQTLYFKYPPFTQYVINLSEISQENQGAIIGPMIRVLTGDEYTYYVDDNGDIKEYFVAEIAEGDIAIGDTYIIVNEEKVKFDPPVYLGNGADFSKNGTDLETPKLLLTELGLYPPAEE